MCPRSSLIIRTRYRPLFFTIINSNDFIINTNSIMNIPGYSGADNVPGTLKFTDTILITTYFLGIGAIGAIVVTEIIRRVR